MLLLPRACHTAPDRLLHDGGSTHRFGGTWVKQIGSRPYTYEELIESPLQDLPKEHPTENMFKHFLLVPNEKLNKIK